VSESGPPGPPSGGGQRSGDEAPPTDDDGQPRAEEGGDPEHDEAGPTAPHDGADSPENAEVATESTGSPEVDSALARLAALDQDLPTSEHPPIFEATLRDLQRALADNPGAEPGQPGEQAQTDP
jgi:hypothetical protein